MRPPRGRTAPRTPTARSGRTCRSESGVSYEFSYRFPTSPRPIRVLHVLSHVVTQMAAITHRLEVCLVTARGIVAEMRRGQYDFPLRPLRWLHVAFFAAA